MLSYREHLTKTAGKLKNHNNLLMGSQHSAVICSGTSKFYSAAEYCAPVWSCSAHTSQVDVQLNSTLVPSVLHLFHGCQCFPTLNSQPYEWRLPLTSWWKKSSNMTVGQIQPDILNPPLLRLTSRKPLWLDLQPVDIKSRWRHNWKSAQVVSSHLVCNPTIRQPGFDLRR